MPRWERVMRVCDMYVLVRYIRAGDVCTRVRSVCRATDDKCQSRGPRKTPERRLS